MANPHEPDPPADLHTLRCMEIWSGHTSTEHRLGMPGLDGWVYSRPHEGSARGGDVHYVSLCGGGIVTRVIVADVSGHGEAVGETASALRSMMRRHINHKDQAGLVRALNRQFAAMEQVSRFATAIVATYLATTRRLTVCNAGHPRPLWYRASVDRWSILAADSPDVPDVINLPLGIDDDAAFEQFAVTLEPGDVVVIYTDALTESTDGDGRQLGEPGLVDLARPLDPADPTRFGPRMLERIVDRHGGRAPDDDVTLLTLHHNGSGPRHPSIGEKLRVYGQVFGLIPT